MSDLGGISTQIVLADYASADAAGKVSVIGGGLGLIGFNASTGLSAPFALWVRLRRRDDGTTSEASVEVTLKDSSGDPVMSAGITGELQAVRVAQNVQFRPTVVPGMTVPIGAVDSTVNLILNFNNGVPLRIDEAYRWVVAVDTEDMAEVGFFVPGLPTPPVIG